MTDRPDERPTILVVDDEAAIRQLVVEGLRRSDSSYELLEAGDGVQASEILQARDVDVVITDLMMPTMGGMELMHWGHQHRPGASWIILSGRGTFEDAVRAVQLGAFDFLSKPLPSIDLLLVTVRNALRQQRLEREREDLVSSVEAQNRRLNEQVEQLCEACRLLGDQAKTIDDDLRRAELIQRALLPRTPPAIGDYSVDAVYRTSQNVGGDVYDVVRVQDRYVLAYVADAAGHGVSAAMLAVLFKHRLHMTEEDTSEPTMPARVLELVNQCIMEECRAPGLFITAAYIVLDMQRQELTAASAGHPPLLLRRSNGEMERIYHTGPALGLRPRATYAQTTVPFEPQDRLLMYTDGLLEYHRGQQQVTVDTIEEMLSRPNMGGKALLDELLTKALPNGNAHQQDDITMVMLCGAGCASAIDNGPMVTGDRTREVPRPPASAILVGRTQGTTVLSIQGDVNWTHAAGLHSAVLKEFDAGQAVLLDLSLCFHLDSTMLGTIQELAEAADQRRASLELQGVLPEVQATFEELEMERALAHVTDTMRPLPGNFRPLTRPEGVDLSGSRMLRAHEVLASLSEQNRQQFGNLVEMLRKELSESEL